MTNLYPLGHRQLRMLKVLDYPSMHRPRAIWHRRSGWNLGGPPRTLRLLESLRSRGLVSYDPELAEVEGTSSCETYRLTSDGESTIARLKACAWDQSVIPMTPFTEARNEQVRAVMAAAAKPLGQTEIASRVNQPWCWQGNHPVCASIRPVLKRIGAVQADRQQFGFGKYLLPVEGG